MAALIAAVAGVVGFGAGYLAGGSAPPAPAADNASPAAATTTTDYDQLCPVHDFMDGDTFEVDYTWHGARRERLRLMNVDTPERGEPLYKEAGDALKALVGDGPVRLEFAEPGKPTRGGYGRLLVYVFTPDGTNVNLELVRQGWSPFFDEYGGGRFPDDFRAAEAEAKAAKRGIWSLRQPDGN